jgi:succinoglycan biosynthesis protein ExoA
LDATIGEVSSGVGQFSHKKEYSVSVIVPVFNDERFIDHCLSSLSRQQGVKYDVIVVLDAGSTDNSGEAVGKWGNVGGYSVISVPHCTIGRALNLGLKMAKGEIVAFAEADKVFDSSWLKNAVDYLEANPEVFGVGSLATPPETRSLVGKCLKEMKEIHLRQLNEVEDIEWGYAYRRSVLEKIGGWNEDLPVGEDRELAKRVIGAGGKIHLIKKADNVHYLSGIYDGLSPLLKKQFSTGRKHAIHHVRSFTSGWILSGVTLLGVLLLALGLVFHFFLVPGILLISSEYAVRLVKFIYVGKGAASIRILFLPLLAVSMNLAYGMGLVMGAVSSRSYE